MNKFAPIFFRPAWRSSPLAFLIFILSLAACTPNLSVQNSGSRRSQSNDSPNGTIDDPDYEPTLEEWTRCDNPETLYPAPTGPQRISKPAYISTLYSFLTSRGAGNALNSYLRPSNYSDVPTADLWAGEGLLELYALPEENRPGEFFTTNQTLSESHVDAYFGVAHTVATQIQNSPTALNLLIGSCHTAAGDRPCFDAFFTRALRVLASRPPDPGELDRMWSRFMGAGGSQSQKWGILIRSLLMHPEFLFFNPQRGTVISASPRVLRLTPYELARKLSYALTTWPPDAELWARAADGSLLTPAVFQAQVARLARPAVNNNSLDFHSQAQIQLNRFYRDYMRTYEVSGVPVNQEDENAAASSPPIYTFNVGYLNHIYEEGYLYFYSSLWQDRTFAQFLTNTTFDISYFRFRQQISPGSNCSSGSRIQTAPHGTSCPVGGGNCTCLSDVWYPDPHVRAYGQLAEHPVLPAEYTLERKVISANIPSRPGVLGRHNFTLNPTGKFFPNIVHAGQKVKSVLACDPTPTPNFAALPADFRSLVPRHQALGVNTADWYKNTTSNAVCMSCHHGPQGMESWGRVFNQFDGFSREQPGGVENIFGTSTGIARTTPIGQAPIDPAADILLDDRVQRVTSVLNLAQTLAQSRQAHICFSRQIFEFFEGRPAKGQDSCSIKTMTETTAARPMREVMESYFNHPHFGLRRLPD